MKRRRVRKRDLIQAQWDGIILQERILDDQLREKKISPDEFERKRDLLWNERKTILPRISRIEGARSRLMRRRERE